MLRFVQLTEEAALDLEQLEKNPLEQGLLAPVHSSFVDKTNLCTINISFRLEPGIATKVKQLFFKTLPVWSCQRRVLDKSPRQTSFRRLY